MDHRLHATFASRVDCKMHKSNHHRCASISISVSTTQVAGCWLVLPPTVEPDTVTITGLESSPVWTIVTRFPSFASLTCPPPLFSIVLRGTSWSAGRPTNLMLSRGSGSDTPLPMTLITFTMPLPPPDSLRLSDGFRLWSAVEHPVFPLGSSEGRVELVRDR